MGIGIVISTLIMTKVKINYEISDYQVEKRARAMGMKYPEEVKFIIDKGESK